MNNKQQFTTKQAPLPPKEPWVPSRFLLCILLAVAIALALVSGVFGALLVHYALSDDKDDSFRYMNTNIADYIADFSAATVTGKHNIPGKDVKPEAVDDEMVKEEIDLFLLSNATAVDGKTNKTAVVDYADLLAVYILDMTVADENGNETRVQTKYFETSYTARQFQIGAKTFGKGFDDALLNGKIIPVETGKLTFMTAGRTADLIKEEGVTAISVSYTATIAGEEQAYEGQSGLRLTLSSSRNELLYNAVVEKCEMVGQRYTFDLTHDIDGDGEDEKVSYAAVVEAVVKEEDVLKLTFTLPEDFFAEGEGEEQTDLNGKELNCYLVIDSSIAYNANTWETMTADEMKAMGYTPVSTDNEATQREKCMAYVKSSLEESYADEEEQIALSLIWEALLEDMTFATLPEEAVKETYEWMYESILRDFYYNGGNMEYADLDSFGPDYYGYDKEEYKDLATYLNEYLVPNYVKQQLLVCAIYDRLIDDPKEEKLTKAYDEWVDSLAAELGTGVTEEQTVEYYGEEYIRMLAIADLAADYLLENNSVNWELAPESEG